MSGRIQTLANKRRRFGYRRVHQLLQQEVVMVNQRMVYRLYPEANLAVPKRKRRKGIAAERQPLVQREEPNRTWPMDFVMIAMARGRRLKCLNLVDD